MRSVTLTACKASLHVDFPTDAPLPRQGGVLLGLGSAYGWLRQARYFSTTHPDCRVMAVNRAIMEWPEHLDLAGSLHNRLIPDYLAKRLGRERNRPDLVVSIQATHDVDVVFPARPPWPLGSSAALIVLAGAFLLQAEAIVLAGVELSGPYERYLKGWRAWKAAGLLDNVYTLGRGPLARILRPASELEAACS